MGKGDASTAWFLICRSQAKLCALPLPHVAETMRPLPLQIMPNMPAYMAGVALIRGTATPVLLLDSLLGSSQAKLNTATRFVTLQLGQRMVCLAVQEVLGVRNLNGGDLQQVPPLLQQTNSELLSSLGLLDAELLLVLQECRRFSEEAWDALLSEQVDA